LFSLAGLVLNLFFFRDLIAGIAKAQETSAAAGQDEESERKKSVGDVIHWDKHLVPRKRED